MGTIDGAYIIDPDFSMPPDIYCTLMPWRTRKSLSLETKLGSIDVVIALMDRGPGPRLEIDMMCKAGSIDAKLVRVFYYRFLSKSISCLPVVRL
jgi:hypothetical protein